MKDPRPLVRSRRVVIGLVFAAAGVIAACSETTAPSTQAQSKTQVAIANARSIAYSLPQAYIAQGLLRTTPLKQDVSVTKTIPSGGGSISIPGTGFQLKIPRGAFPESQLTFTVTAHAGNAIAYDFEPHGHAFLRPLTFMQDVNTTNLKGAKVPPGFVLDLTGAYFPSDMLVDPTTGIAVVTELLPTDMQLTLEGKNITFPIKHFSGYLISVGRSQEF